MARDLMTPRPEDGAAPAWGRRSNEAATVEEVFAALSLALDLPLGSLELRSRLVAGRSTIFMVETPRPVRGRSRWVVKEPYTDYVQLDVDDPVGGAEEFRALQWLSAHFDRAGGPVRVPEPLALLPEVGALAMEYVPGPSVRDLIRYRSLRRPTALLKGLAGAAEFIRGVHALEQHEPQPVRLDVEAQRVLRTATEVLRAYGLELDRRVAETLAGIPPVTVSCPQVRLHGDFGPSNVILAGDGTTVGIDMNLSKVGPPEGDVARFVALISGGIRFAPGLVAPPVSWLRRRLERQFLRSYYGTSTYPAMFELKLIEVLAGRWVRLRQLGEKGDPKWLLPIRLRAVKWQIRMLMLESSRRLARAVAA
jgi:aminoglycoside phosphotransferase (APT) family kinase protein